MGFGVKGFRVCIGFKAKSSARYLRRLGFGPSFKRQRSINGFGSSDGTRRVGGSLVPACAPIYMGAFHKDEMSVTVEV